MSLKKFCQHLLSLKAVEGAAQGGRQNFSGSMSQFLILLHGFLQFSCDCIISTPCIIKVTQNWMVHSNEWNKIQGFLKQLK